METTQPAVVALALLDTANTALAADRKPTRAFRSHNAPAWEACAETQLTVHWLAVTHRQVPKGRHSREEWQFHVQLVRCVPGLGEGAKANAALLDASAAGLQTDLADIMKGVKNTPAIFGGTCDGVTWGQGIPLGPSGDVAAVDWTVTWAPTT